MLHYEQLNRNIAEQIETDRKCGTSNPFAFNESDVIRRVPDRDKASVWRTAFIRDIDKIIHCPYYSRYADKTQVFSFYKNDDITRRGLHVQLVSRIARTIGKALGLNLDLIEAISLGHDIGHTPFGHAGEGFLDALLYSHAGKHFSHNIQSVRVLDTIFPYNISLQTLNGIASHDGELELCEYHPQPLKSFDEFDRQIEDCLIDKGKVKRLAPCTLEGCVVRISDIIAYLGKDRQDAIKARLKTDGFEDGALGRMNAEIINNLIVNIIENSYGKAYIKMDDEHFGALQKAKSDNYDLIYRQESVESEFKKTINPMMESVYETLLSDLNNSRVNSPIFTHHIDYVTQIFYTGKTPYCETEHNQIVADYIASMTDDYFIDLHSYLFPRSKHRIKYKGYFD